MLREWLFESEELQVALRGDDTRLQAELSGPVLAPFFEKVCSHIDTGIPALRVWVTEKLPRDQINNPVPMRLSDSAFPDIPTDVIALPRSFNPAEVTPGQSCSIVNDVKSTGTISCMARRNNALYSVYLDIF